MPRRYEITAITLFILLLIASLTFARQSGSAQEPVSLGGTVVASDTGQPVAHASVSLNPGFTRFLPAGATGYPYTSVTDDKGEFHFSGVKPGRYAIVVDANHFVDDLNRGSKVYDPGQIVSGVQLAVTPAGTISGKVLDENGNALVRYRVEILELRYNPDNGRPEFGESRPVFGRDAETDDKGTYRVSGLLPGKHYVRVLSPGLLKDDEVSYPVTYYPGMVDPGQAAPVLLGIGSESHADVSLRPGGVHIRGKVVGLDSGASLRILRLILGGTTVDEGLTERVNRSKRQRDGEFDFDGITPGSYSLFENWAAADKTVHVSRIAVEVNNKDQNNVALPLRPGIDIEGRFVVDSGLTVPADFFKRAHVRSKPIDRPDFAPRTSSDVSDQGEFVLKQFDEGRYSFPILPLFGNAYVSEIRLDGKTSPDLTFEVTPATHGPLEIHLSAGASILKGTVRDAQNNPVPRVTVVLEPDVARRSNTSLFKWGPTDASGQFVIGVPAPGDYKAFALDNSPNDMEVRSAIFMSKYEALGKAVHIDPGSKAEIDLRVIAAGKN